MSPAPLVLVTSTSDLTTPTQSADPGTCAVTSSRVWVNQTYSDALIACGLVPLILPPLRASMSIAALESVVGLVLTGGEDIDPRRFGEAPHPATGTAHELRDECEIALARTARQRRMPTLAICRGAQIVNVALGGGVCQDIGAAHPRGGERVHAVELEPDSRLASILGATRVGANGYHHQAISRSAPQLRVVGRSSDDVVEAIESTDRDWWMVGVQWHAEELTATPEDWDRRLFSAFAEQVHARCRG